LTRRTPLGNLICRIEDEGRDFARGSSGPLGEFADLLGDDGEALAGLAGTGGLDAGIQGQQVGLEGDLVDDADDAARSAAKRALDAPDGLDGGTDHLDRLTRCVPRLLDDVSRVARPDGGFLDRGGDLFERRRRLLQGRSLLLGTAAKRLGIRLEVGAVFRSGIRSRPARFPESSGIRRSPC
jgi:hypothetical protein